MRVLLSSHTLAISSTCEVWFPVNRGERNESRIAVTPDPSVFLEGLARETRPCPKTTLDHLTSPSLASWLLDWSLKLALALTYECISPMGKHDHAP